MFSDLKENKVRKFAEVVGVTLLVYLVFKYMLPIVMPFVLAYAIGNWVYPLVLKIHRKTRLPVGITGSILIFLLAAVCLSAAGLVLYYIYQQLQSIMQNGENIMSWFEGLYVSVSEFIGRIFDCDPAEVTVTIESWIDKMDEALMERLIQFAATLGMPLIKSIGTFIIVITIGFVAAVILVKNKRKMTLGLKRNLFAKEMLQISHRTGQVAVCFFKTQAIVMLIIAAICAAGLLLTRTPYAVLISVVIALLDALPVIGSGTFLMPWAIICLFYGQYMRAVVLIALYVLCTLVRQFLEPRLMGNNLGINEFYMLMATFTGIALFGLWGIILGPLGLVIIIEVLNQLDDLNESGNCG